jgi:FkbM family methyltransferase
MGHIQGDWKPQYQAQQTLEIDAITLDDFVYQEVNPRPDFIKIDVEGAEANVLKGAQQLLTDVKPMMVLELHSSQTAEEVGEILSAMGYRIYDLEGSFA